MKFSLRAMLALMCAAALFLLPGCQTRHADEASVSTSSTEAFEPATYYMNASQATLEGQNLSMQMQVDTQLQAGASLFTKHASRSLTIMNRDSEYMRAALEETLVSGSQSVSIRERFANGMLYMSVNDSRFVSAMSASDYQARFVTGNVFTPDLYSTITATQVTEGMQIQFRSALMPEAWALPANGRFLSAEGDALVNADGYLIQCSYTLCYSTDGAELRKQWQITYVHNPVPSIDVPSTLDGYVTLSDAAIPRILEEATGYLTQADSISAQTVHTITSEAFGITRQQNSQLHLYDREETLLAYRSSLVELVSHSNGDEVTTTSQAEYFTDGTYRIEANNTEATPREKISQEQMRTYCQELLVSTILLPEYITDMHIVQDGDVYRLELTASEALAQLLCSNACKILYDDSELLNTLSSAYATNEISAYLEIDLSTGLPTASGIHYSGTHTIQQTAYALSSRIDQVYTPVSEIAYDAITQSQAPEATEPSVEATTESTDATA